MRFKKSIILLCLFLISSLAIIPQLASALENYTFVSELNGYIPQTNNFAGPMDVAVDSSGNIYVLDAASNSIKKFNSQYEAQTLTFDRTFDFSQTGFIALDSAGNIYVCDYLNVRKFSSTGSFITNIGTWTAGNPMAFDFGKIPRFIAVDSSNVYVVGSGPGLVIPTPFGPVTIPTYYVYKFSPSGGSYVESTLCASGFDANNGPVGLAGVAAYGDFVFVAVSGNNTMQKFSDSGVLQASWNLGYTPSFVETDSSGNVFVTCLASNCVQKLSSSGVLLATIGSAGSAQGQFIGPMGVAIDSDGYVYVADYGNNRVQKFSLQNSPTPTPTPPPTSNYIFVFNTIPNPQHVGVPFTTSVSVLDGPLGNHITTWTGTATLTCSNGAGISPLTINIVNGYWEGSLVIDSPGTLIYVTATADDGTTGGSTNFNVLSGLTVVPEPPFWVGFLAIITAVGLVTIYQRRSFTKERSNVS